ncbi:MAG TPA: FkbM family methyltransferase [Pseudolabrys sp.]
MRTTGGIIRSFRIYYGHRDRVTAMDNLYGQFIGRGDLVFDIGSHVGDRIASFCRLGARVIAVEPQPAMVAVLKLLYGRNPAVTIEPVAAGQRAGTVKMMINPGNPTVSTTSQEFINAARDAPGWEDQRWTKTVEIPMTTVDALIIKYGKPVFIKIDVEGLEAEVLAGLTQAVRALSFEFTTIQREVAQACIERCLTLGYARFNGALGESQVLAYEHWVDGAAIANWLTALPQAANSGDIYARLA